MSNIYQTRVGRSLENRPRLAILLALGVALLMSSSCGSEPEQYDVEDLVESFAFAEVDQERPYLDLGTQDARPALGSGWSWDGASADGTTFVWAEGERSELDVFLVRSRDLKIEMRCMPFRFPGAPIQQVEVLWDGEAVASIQLNPGFTQVTLDVARKLADAGHHRLTLNPSYAEQPQEVIGGEDARRLSFACDWLRFGDEPALEESEDPAGPKAEGDTLWIPAGTEISYYLEPDQEIRLAWDQLSSRGDASLSVSWEVEDGPPRIYPVNASSGFVDFPGPFKEVGPARLGLRASASNGLGGVVLRRARLMKSGDRTAETAAPEITAPEIQERAHPAREQEPSAKHRPPILLWVVDTLRADRLGVYGHDLPTSPHFDALAERSTVFEQAQAQSSWTRPTMATLLTGVGPEGHGIRGVDDGLNTSFETLAERLQDEGYTTGGFSTNGNVSRDTQFDQGFDRFEYAAVDAPTIAEQALAWLDELERGKSEQPFFLMLLTTEPHASYEPIEPHRGRFAAELDDPWLGTAEHIRALGDKKSPATDEVVEGLFSLYDAEIAWNDQVFGEFQRRLEHRGLDPLIVVVADHGEAFRERGVFGHGWDLHREVLHIPFWIHLPEQEEGRRIADPVQQADLMSTLLEWIEGDVPDDVDGESLVPYLETPEETLLASGSTPGADRLLISTMDYEGRAGASLIRGRYKVIEPISDDFASERQLFDLVNDPEELHNLAAERPLLAGRLVRLLKQRLAAHTEVEAEAIDLDPETRKQLEALGYLN